MTLALLASAAQIILVIRGRDKRAVLEEAIAGRNRLPVAQLLAAAKSPVTIFWAE